MISVTRGHTILEILVSLLLVTPLLAASVQLFAHLSRLQKYHSRASDVFFNEYKTRGFFRRSMLDVDSHRFQLLPRIHPRGHITYADGSEHPVLSAHGRFKVDGKSSALSSFELDTEHTLSVLESSSPSLVRACPRFGLSVSPSYRAFLGIHPQGLGEFLVVQRSSSTGLCEQLRLRATAGLISGPLEQVPVLLVPITRSYVLYRTQTGQLRYVGHEGRQVTENSLVAPRVDSLYTSLSPGAQPNLYTLQLHYGSKSKVYYFPSLLQREPIENFILQFH